MEETVRRNRFWRALAVSEAMVMHLRKLFRNFFHVRETTLI